MLNQRLNITVLVAPNTIDTGQMVQISSIITDKLGAPVVVPTLYMEIIDSKGRVYWKLSPIIRDANGFSKLISTNELKSNTRYTVRVSTNTKLSPQGYAFFKTSKRKIIPILITSLMAPSVLIPKRAQNPIWLIYRTMLDAKVCSICKPHEGKKFRPNDDRIIRIGPPELGGETHYGDRCHYDMILNENPAHAKVKRMLKAIRIVMAVNTIKKHKEKELYR